MRIFGRNKDRPLADEYEAESERVLKAVSSNKWADVVPTPVALDELGAYEAWAPYTSIFQRTAFEGPYGDIVSILARIESKAMFDERN